MDYEKLKKEIKEIADISLMVPEPFKQKCFELLLTQLLGKNPKTEDPKPDKNLSETGPVGDKLSIKAQLRVFMQKTQTTEEILNKVVMSVNGEVHFLKEPGSVPVAKGQRQWALLLALKNALLNDTFAVDPEDLRSICQDKGFYDTANFATNMKKVDFSKLFKKPLEAQGGAQTLSNEGQQDLATLLKSLAGSEE